jgi:hypothetical protein
MVKAKVAISYLWKGLAAFPLFHRNVHDQPAEREHPDEKGNLKIPLGKSKCATAFAAGKDSGRLTPTSLSKNLIANYVEIAELPVRYRKENMGDERGRQRSRPMPDFRKVAAGEDCEEAGRLRQPPRCHPGETPPDPASIDRRAPSQHLKERPRFAMGHCDVGVERECYRDQSPQKHCAEKPHKL